MRNRPSGLRPALRASLRDDNHPHPSPRPSQAIDPATVRLPITRCWRWPLEPGQFVSLAFGQKARDAGIAVSMGSKGCAFDNAVAESFFATLKKELVHRRSWLDPMEN